MKKLIFTALLITSIILTINAQKTEKPPKMAQWTEGLETLIKNNDCEGLKAYPWAYKIKVNVDPDDYEVADGADPIIPNTTPNVGIFEINKSSDFVNYWIVNGVALAKCGEYIELLTDYTNLQKGADARKGKPNLPTVYYGKVEQYDQIQLWKSIEKVVGADKLFEDFKALLSNKSISQSVRDECAGEIMSILDVGWLERVEKRYAEILLPYFSETQTWIYYMESTDYKAAIPQITKAMNNKDYGVRIQAISALGNWKVKSALSKLQEIASSDPYYTIEDGVKVYHVRDEAAEAVRKIKAQ